MSEWITVATYPALTEEVAQDMQRWEQVAEDMALYPQHNVRCIEQRPDQVLLQVSDAINEAFDGALGKTE